MSSPAIDRLLSIEDELVVIREEVDRRVRLRSSLMTERSAILMSMTYADRVEYERGLMARAARPVDEISAVRVPRAT